MPKLYDYLDYRTFLNDLYEERKTENPVFSLRVMSNKVGMDVSHLYRVIQKKAHLADRYLETLSDWLGFDKSQKEYLELLVQLSKCKKESESRLVFQKLMSFKRFPSVRLHAQRYEYFSNWHHAAIRSIMSVKQIRISDAAQLAKWLSPDISAKEVKDSITLLQRLQLIRLGTDGTFEVTDMHLTTEEQYRSLAVRTYQRENMRLGIEALERHAIHVRDISTLTICIDAATFEEIKDLTREYRRMVLEKVEACQNAERIYQFNIQVFPVSQNLPI